MESTNTIVPTRRLVPLALGLAAAVVLAASIQAFAYWPGIMTWDSIRQYGQALSGDFDDWHPPAMGWVWQQFSKVRAGPAPMLLLQLALYWTGFGLLVAKALKMARPGLAIALAASALLPIPFALMGAVLKDCLMAGALLSAVGVLALVRPDRDIGLRAIGLALIVAAATLRFNAVLACLPLAVALLPKSWRNSGVRLVGCSVIAGAILLSAMPVANRLIGARPSGVQTSLIIFDLGGITEYSGIDVFPALPLTNPVAINHHCYSPVKWDPYSWWVDEPCPIGFDLVRSAFENQHQSAPVFWLRAIAAHPLAYAVHRLAHFNINTRFLVREDIERPVQVTSVANIWKYQVQPNVALKTIDTAALEMAISPFGWPITWLAIALGTLIVSQHHASRSITVPLALSAFLYGSGYLVVSVASEIRYHLWTMLAAMIALVFVGSDIVQDGGVTRPRLFLAFLPTVLTVTTGVVWRLLPS